MTDRDKIEQEAVRAYLAAMEAQGFVMLPVEATQAMWDAADDESARIHHSQHWAWIYAAMIAARPHLPADLEREG